MTTIDKSVTVVSIHDKDARNVLSFDVLEILEAIEQSARDHWWVVGELECIGDPPPCGTVLSFDHVVRCFQRVEQTIDGVIVAGPPSAFASANIVTVARLGDFPSTQNRLAIVAVDSSYFDVASKDAGVVEQLRRKFRDVRDIDPRDYFGGGEEAG